jgi:hypothetical protein
MYTLNFDTVITVDIYIYIYIFITLYIVIIWVMNPCIVGGT